MRYGKLAKECCGTTLPLKVLKSVAGFYIGTENEEGPVSRESAEYWPTGSGAKIALDSGKWGQREEP